MVQQAPAQSTAEDSAKRRRRRWIFVGVVLLLLGCCLVSAAGLSYVVWRRSEGKEILRGALDSVGRAEEALTPVDQLVDQDFVNVQLVDVEKTAQALDEAERDIEQVMSHIESAEGEVVLGGELLAVLGKTKKVLESETAAVGVAKTILEAAGEGSVAMPIVRKAWKDVAAERDLVSRAVKAYNKHTQAGARQATALYRRALTKARSAQAGYASAQKAFPAADLTPYSEYARRRIAHIQSGIRINQKYLAGDTAGANLLIDGYNVTGEQLRMLLDGLSSPKDTRPVTEAIRFKAATALATYAGSRRDAQARAKQLEAAIERL